ncbi:hypothetical protein NIES267_04270 [Calothrix parasitica NIES-267]|uniref:Uncharacterized protein n=1 Tax=Calothrix parasitica NIES-267 TaxID=1973488 RepID=A0A1Z4LIA6_9CYAN|nr:hypothetical protein NIES267_04270 [Calothrix parasitica NIES-267]
MSIYKSTQSLLEISLRIGSTMFLVIGAAFVIPNAGAALNSTPAEQSKTNRVEQDSSDLAGYEPPSNFGRPLSDFSSGTR